MPVRNRDQVDQPEHLVEGIVERNEEDARGRGKRIVVLLGAGTDVGVAKRGTRNRHIPGRRLDQ